MEDSELKARYCPDCKQVDFGQTGEYPCSICGVPTAHDPIQPGRPFDLNEMRRLMSRAVTDDESDALALWMVRNGYAIAAEVEQGWKDTAELLHGGTAAL